VQVAGGTTGVPASATEVVLNVTSVNNIGPGYLQVFPRGSSAGVSAVNFYYARQLTQSMVTVPVDAASGKVTVRSSTADDVVVDELGYYAPEPSSAPAGTGAYVALPPQRICDTRESSHNGVDYGHYNGCPGQAGYGDWIVQVQVTGNGGVPSTGLIAVVLNLTVVDDPNAGYVQAYQHGTARPTSPPTSTVNYNGEGAQFEGNECQPGGSGPTDCQIVANRVIVPIDSSGGGIVDVYVSQGHLDLVVDVNGYFSDGSGSAPTASFHPVTETRLHDTRSSGDTLPAAGQRTVGVAGAAGSPVPAGAKAAVLTVTIDKTQPPTPANGFLTVYPGPSSTSTPPTVSDLNFAADAIVAAQVYATLGSDGSIDIYNGSARPIDAIVDVYGYFS
jgi:hypothetical protein